VVAMRRPPLVDLLVAAALLVAGLAASLGSDNGASEIVVVAFTLAYTLPLALRRVAPLVAPSLAVVAVLAFGVVVEDASQPTIVLAVGLAAYTIGHDVRMPMSGVACVVLVAGFWIAMLATGSPAADLVFVVINYGAPWLFGRVLRDRAEHAEAARGRAIEDERARIARELHDVVAHALSVVAVQTQAVRRRLEPHQGREADHLTGVEGAVREAMREMRRLFGVLRANGAAAPLAPQPELGDLEELLAEARAAGLEVRAEVELPAAGIPAGLGLAAYRIVQEALTNVRRHAKARSVLVRVSDAGESLDVEVRDDGHGPSGGVPGHGLVGMRERVALYGGTLEAGAAPGGGFRVRAQLPLGGAPPGFAS
jgi:signal transduction histidine kinase